MRALRMCLLTLQLVISVLRLCARHGWRFVRKQLEKRNQIQLRDAMTGQKLGMTKAQHKRYVRALGTKDERQIIKAYREVRARRAGLGA